MLGNNDSAKKVTTQECCKLQHFTIPVSNRMYSFKYLRLKIQVQIKTQIQAAQISAVETCHSCVIGENLNNLQKSRYPTKLAAPSSLGADILWEGGRGQKVMWMLDIAMH